MFVYDGFGLKNYALEVARGNIPGQSSVNKFGHNKEIDSGVTADIWDGGYTVTSGGDALIWLAPTAARIHGIASSSDLDGKTAAPSSVGARTLRVYGLTTWGTAESSEDITLDGTTSVNTASSYVIIHRMKVLTSGSTSINVGEIKATAASDGTITARIQATHGQTEMAIYGVPSTQKAYIGIIYVSVNKSGGAAASADTHILVNENPDVQTTNFIIKHVDGVTVTGTSHLHHSWYTPVEIIGPAIIKINAVSSVNNNDVAAGFDLILVDN